MSDNIKVQSKARGTSGIVSASGIYEEEYLNELRGVEGAIKYDRMRRSDPQVRKLRSAVINPIKAGVWEIEAAEEDKDEKQAEVIRQIIFKDFPGGWKQKLGEILSFVDFGHSVFEIIHENKTRPDVGPYTGLKNLAFRSPKSIIEWIRDKVTGEIIAVKQETTGDINLRVEIPAEFLLMFFNEREGDDNGFSMLRPLYGSYKRKLLNLQLLAIGNERHAIGTVIATMPADSFEDDAECESVREVLESFVSHESSYILKPDTVTIEFHSNEFKSANLDASIKAEDERMAGAWLATFLELGIGGNGGAFALGNDLSDFFLSGIESIAHQVTEVFNNKLIPHLTEINFGPDAVPPKMRVSGISDKAGKEMAEVLNMLAGGGLLDSDGKLKDFIRNKFNLPEAEEILEPVDPVQPEPGADPEKPDGENPDDEEKTEPDPNDAEEEEKLSAKGVGIQLSEKTPRGLIVGGAEEVREIMERNVRGMSEKYINDVLNKYNSLPEKQKLKSVEGIKVGKTAIYKQELRAKLTDLAVRALDQVKMEVPGFEDLKFKAADDPEAVKLAAINDIKLSEESRLPTRIKVLLGLQAKSLVDKQANELESRVSFQFQSSQSSTNDAAIIKKDLTDAAAAYTKSPAIVAGSANTAATIINDTRKAFFDNSEVLDQIQSFTFVNSNPETEICQFLAGKTFEGEDAEAWRYQAPLHHNCKTWIRSNLKTSKGAPKVTEGGIRPPASAMKSITLKDK